jgi:hypothetical protein
VVDQCLTAQSFVVILLKKQVNARYWPRLQKAGGVLPYVGTDFKRWTWEGDQSDDIIHAMMDGGAQRTNGGQDFRQVIL